MSNHNHSECEHELKYCKQCKIVYCSKCEKEWIETASNYIFTNNGEYLFAVPNTTTFKFGPVSCDLLTDCDDCTSSCVHNLKS
jgi:hypothetical protein